MRCLFILCFLLVVFTVISGRRSGGGGGRRGGGGSRSSGGSWWRKSSSSSSSHNPSSSSGSSHTPSHGTTGGWKKPATSGNKGDLPSSNIGPGGYPVQKNHPSKLPAYSPNDPRRNSPPPSYNSIYGSPGSHWGPPPAYSSRTSYHGIPSSSYPRQSGFGYPGGQTYHQSSYNGHYMSPPTYNSNYGYSGGGNWGFQQPQSSGLSSGLTGFLIGYQTNSLIHSISNPWGYGSYGHSNYNYHRYRNRNNNNNNSTTATNTTEPANEMEPCVTFNTTNGISTPVVNPNCSCDPIAFKDNLFGHETTQYRCARKEEEKLDGSKLYQNVTEYAGGFKTYLPPEEAPKGPQEFKLKALTKEGRREEAYEVLEKIVTMGRFVSSPLDIPITDGVTSDISNKIE